jgi:UPF0271 protein
MIEDADEAVRRAVEIAAEGRTRTADGAELRLEADTICIHGDRADAALFARTLREGLERSGVRVAAPLSGG